MLGAMEILIKFKLLFPVVFHGWVTSVFFLSFFLFPVGWNPIYCRMHWGRDFEGGLKREVGREDKPHLFLTPPQESHIPSRCYQAYSKMWAKKASMFALEHVLFSLPSPPSCHKFGTMWETAETQKVNNHPSCESMFSVMYFFFCSKTSGIIS